MEEKISSLSVTKLAFSIRFAEQKILEAFKDGKIGGTVHTCLGQELLPSALAEHFLDFTWFSNHRGHGHFLAKTQNFRGLFAELLGKRGGASGGIGGSQHLFGSGFFSNGILGGMAPIAAGYSSDSKDVGSLLFIGDGAANQGVFYESLNIARVISSRLLVVLEDNGIAQSTHSESLRSGPLVGRLESFGFRTLEVSGNHLSELTEASKMARDLISEFGQVALVVKSHRLGPHSKGDDTRSETEVADLWRDDFLTNLAKTRKGQQEAQEAISIVGNAWAEAAASSPEILGDGKLTKSHRITETESKNVSKPQSDSESINKCLRTQMSRNPELQIWGEDIQDDPGSSGQIYGGAFKVTKGLSRDFGVSRVRNMPISEAAIVGAGIGRALSGRPTIVEIMFSDFLPLVYDQIVNHLSKIQGMYGKRIPLPLLIRTASGRGTGYGPTHSGNLETRMKGIPGLNLWVLHARSPYDVILEEAVVQGSPSLVAENKSLYRNVSAIPVTRFYSMTDRACGCSIATSDISSSFVLVAIGSVLSDLLRVADLHLIEQEWAYTIIAPSKISPHSCECVFDLLESAEVVVFFEESSPTDGLGPFIYSSHLVARKRPCTVVRFFGGSDLVPSHKSLEEKVSVTFESIDRNLRHCRTETGSEE